MDGDPKRTGMTTAKPSRVLDGNNDASRDMTQESWDGTRSEDSLPDTFINDSPGLVKSKKRTSGNDGRPCLPSRWPNPSWVRSSSQYKRYALEAGDGLGRREGIPGKRPRHQRTNEPICWDAGLGVVTNRVDEEGSKQGRPIKARPKSSRGLRKQGPRRRLDNAVEGAGSSGVQRLKEDFRQGLVSVRIAWGVRIDALRGKRDQDARKLRIGHRAELDEVRAERKRSTKQALLRPGNSKRRVMASTKG